MIDGLWMYVRQEGSCLFVFWKTVNCVTSKTWGVTVVHPSLHRAGVV